MQIDPERLARAVHLDVERLHDHTYRVVSLHHAYLVDLTTDPECACPDRTIRGAACKHILGCMLAEGDRDVIRTLRTLVRYPGAIRLIRAA
jgi:hypothetical protein